MFDYESPIKQFCSEVTMEYDNGVLRAVQNVGFHVNKEELTKALAYDRGQYDKGYEDGLNADKWIPCSERLPELNTMVMCFTVNETYVIAEYGGPDSHYLDSKDVWFSGQGWYRKDAIIAWQPLPAPYQKGE